MLAFGFFLWSILYLLNPIFHREDWKSLAYYLKQKKIEEVYMVPSSSDPLIYYYPQIKVDSFKKCQNDNFSLNREKVYVIPYTVEIHGVDYKNCFKNNYQLIKRKTFQQIILEEYQKL